jgi:serine/threonine-protein kinase
MAGIPARIGKYRITQLIAQGGMSAVYKGVHPTLKRNVILKKLTVGGSTQFIERFKREARIMMDFKHDGIVTVYDHFKEGSSYYIVLEYVDGLSLDELIRRRRSIPDALGLYIFLQVCLALKYAHDSGVIHRDIKPSNILISRKGEVKLVDFGIAGYAEEREEGLTAQGMTLGTLAYMPPEQFKDTRNVDKCADIYAMGVMLYEMATGKKPFPGNFSPQTLLTIQRGKYVRVRRMNPKIDKVFGVIIGKMIQPKKEKRYQDLAPVIRILRKRLRREDGDELEKRLIAAVNGSEYKAPARKGRRLVRRLVPIGLSLLVILAAAWGWLYLGGAYFERIRPLDYGKLEVELRFGKGEKSADHRVSARLLSQGADVGAPAIELRMPGFVPAALAWLRGEKGDESIVSSGKLYLKPGDYLLQATVSEKQYSEYFYLPPFKMEEAEGRGRGMELSYSYAGHTPKPLTFSFKALDARMRQDITDSASLSVQSSFGYWFGIDALPKDELVSGRTYLLLISADGYEPTQQSISVGPLQTDVFFQVSLMPIEGRLSIGSSLAGIKVTVNGMDVVLGGGASRKLQSLRLVGKEPLHLSLPPGRIRLEASAGERKGSEEVNIRSGQELRLIIEAARGTRGLSFTRVD